MKFTWLIITLLMSTAAWGAEITGLGGMVYTSSSDSSNVTAQIELRDNLTRHVGASFTYLNEGHLPDHHRDGYGVQFWAGDTFGERLDVAVGLGPYLYYDTVPKDNTALSINRHGVALLSALTATWRLDEKLLLQLRFNGVASSNSFDTVSALFGIGYRLDSPPKAAADRVQSHAKLSGSELALFAGEASVFNNGPAHSLAGALEYRQPLLRYLDWSATLLYEGNSDIIDRGGVVTQLWVRQAFLDDKLSLGVGFGPYFAHDGRVEPGRGGKGYFLLTDLAMTAAYRFDPRWGGRFTWHRISTSNDRDADVWLLGIGYLF